MKPYDKTQCESTFLKGYSGCCCKYCHNYRTQRGKWIVNKKGSPTSNSHEIAIVRETNRHGIASYGWPDSNKIIISSATYHTMPVEAFNAILKVAKDLANTYNKKEAK